MEKLSASRIKTLLTCGLSFWYQYREKIPQTGNDGSSRGSVTHEVLERLLRPDRRTRVEKILRSKDPWTDHPVQRYARIWADKLGVGDKENFDMIRKFILVALQLDFYCEGADEVHAEIPFEIKTSKYWVGGFIDKTAIYPDEVKIHDYKTSKAKFAGKDKTFNLQNYIYNLAARKLHPGKPSSLSFQFLKMHKAPIQEGEPISDEEMAGFEEWLGYISDYIDKLTFKEAQTNLAINNVETRWMCNKGVGDLNAAGLPAWYCQYKYPFIYFALVEDGKVISTSRAKNELDKKVKVGQVIEQREHKGCHYWNIKNQVK